MVCCVRKGHSECHRVYFPGQKEVKSVGKRYWMETLWERGTEVSWAGPKTHQGLFVKLETTAVTSVCVLLNECLCKILKFCKTNSVSEFKNTHLNKLFENSREKNMSAENLLCLKTNLAASADCGIPVQVCLCQSFWRECTGVGYCHQTWHPNPCPGSPCLPAATPTVTPCTKTQCPTPNIHTHTSTPTDRRHRCKKNEICTQIRFTLLYSSCYYWLL